MRSGQTWPRMEDRAPWLQTSTIVFCAICRRGKAIAACDFQRFAGACCDLPLCADHVAQVAFGRDVCPTHRAVLQGIKAVTPPNGAIAQNVPENADRPPAGDSPKEPIPTPEEIEEFVRLNPPTGWW